MASASPASAWSRPDHLRPRQARAARPGRAARARAARGRRSASGSERCSTLSALVAVAVIWALIQYQDVIADAADRLRRALLAYVLYEAFKLRARRPRDRMFADPFPDRAQSAVLGPVRAGRRLAQPLHRPLRRPRRGAGLAVPVDQPDLHRHPRAGVRGAVDVARQAGLEPSAPAKFGLAWCSSGSASWCSCGAR